MIEKETKRRKGKKERKDEIIKDKAEIEEEKKKNRKGHCRLGEKVAKEGKRKRRISETLR